MDDFTLWVETSKPDSIIDTLMPWDNFKRQPAEYTREEYEAMPVELQGAFFEWFESADLFEEWVKKTAGLEVLIEYGIVDSNADLSSETLIDDRKGEKIAGTFQGK